MLLKVISLYTGIGGLDFGFEAAGFDTAVAVEFDKTCCATMRLNRPNEVGNWKVVEGDIHDVTSEQILAAGGLEPGEADVLIGGPPCQPFSKTGYWARGDALRLNDPRAGTLGAYLRVLRDTRPRAFLLENVAGLAFKGKDEGLQLLLEGIRQINKEIGTNYQVHWKVLNAADYGVPQFRERVFLIGSRDGRSFSFPSPTHGENAMPEIPGQPVPGYRTTWDALGDLPEENSPELKMKGKWADLLPTIPEGENYLFHTNRGKGEALFGWRKRYWSFLLKLAKNQPSWTIQAQPGPAIGPFHWSSRRLSAAELCRLQTFPDGLTFDCPLAAVQKMLGNAVPSLLAEVLAHEIRAQLLDAPAADRTLKLLPPDRSPVPPPEPAVKRVPAKYMHLVGDHDDHPGTGKGPAALKRLAVAAVSGKRKGSTKDRGGGVVSAVVARAKKKAKEASTTFASGAEPSARAGASASKTSKARPRKTSPSKAKSSATKGKRRRKERTVAS